MWSGLQILINEPFDTQFVANICIQFVAKFLAKRFAHNRFPWSPNVPNPYKLWSAHQIFYEWTHTSLVQGVTLYPRYSSISQFLLMAPGMGESQLQEYFYFQLAISHASDSRSRFWYLEFLSQVKLRGIIPVECHKYSRMLLPVMLVYALLDIGISGVYLCNIDIKRLSLKGRYSVGNHS